MNLQDILHRKIPFGIVVRLSQISKCFVIWKSPNRHCAVGVGGNMVFWLNMGCGEIVGIQFLLRG